MFNIGMPELIVIFIVALLIFGPKKLPELGKTLGQAMAQFKRTSQEFKDNLDTEVGTSKIKEDLLKQQKELQESLTAANKPSEEKRPGPKAEKAEKPHAG